MNRAAELKERTVREFRETLVLSGPLADAVGDALGFSVGAVTTYEIVKWSLLVAVPG